VCQASSFENLFEYHECHRKTEGLVVLIGKFSVIGGMMAYGSFEHMAVSVIRSCANSDRDADIFVRNKGIVGNGPVELVRLAESYGISRERARQIVKNVLEKLRNSDRPMPLVAFGDVVLKLLLQNAGLLGVEELANGLQVCLGWKQPPTVTSLASLLEVTSLVMVDKDNAIIAVQDCPCLACEDVKEHLGLLFEGTVRQLDLLDAGRRLAKLCGERCKRRDHFPVFFGPGWLARLTQHTHAVKVENEYLFSRDGWIIAHGKRLEQVVFTLLRLAGNPLHFKDLAHQVRTGNSRYRSVSDHRVQNCLIGSKQFQTAGQGIWGLSDWDMERTSTCRDCIHEILRAKAGPMFGSEIISTVVMRGGFKRDHVRETLRSDPSVREVASNQFELTEDPYFLILGSDDSC